MVCHFYNYIILLLLLYFKMTVNLIKLKALNKMGKTYIDFFHSLKQFDSFEIIQKCGLVHVQWIWLRDSNLSVSKLYFECSHKTSLRPNLTDP